MEIKKHIAANNFGFHQFSFPTLECYFSLSSEAVKNRVSIQNNGDILIIKNKAFVYNRVTESMLKELSEKYVVFVQENTDLPDQKINEIVYNLPEVFDPSSYKNQKTRHKRIRYPFSALKRKGYIIKKITEFGDPEISKLHEEWVAHKINDPKVFHQQFPTKRYINCFLVAEKNFRDYMGFSLFDQNGQLQGVSLYGLEGKKGMAYEMASFGKYWEMSSQFFPFFRTCVLKELLENGIQKVNSGYAAGSLRKYKQHLPHSYASFYKIPKQKTIKPTLF